MNNRQGDNKRVVDIVTEIFEALAETSLAEYELVDVAYVKEGPQRYLRLFIDKEGGISLDDCKIVSRAVDDKLEELDMIKEAYILEVSSPGIERPLKKFADFQRFVGRDCEIKLYTPINGLKLISGKILKTEGDIIFIETMAQKAVVEIPYDKVGSAKLSFHFDF